MSTTTTEMEERPVVSETENESVFKSRIMKNWKNAKKEEVKKLKDYFGPTGVWLLSYYVISIFIMIVLNILRVGWSFEAIFAAPSYFAQLFINYGLNAGKVDAGAGNPFFEPDFYYEKIEFGRALIAMSWLFSPVIIYVLGILLAILPGSGYALPQGGIDYLLNFQYFHERTPLLNPGTKSGGFYFMLVWVPIIVSTLASAVISNRIFKERKTIMVNVIGIMIINIIAGFLVGIQMGLMTGTIRLSLLGGLETMLTNSRDNFGYVFDGQYHPNTIMITSWFINLVPIFIVAIWHVLYKPIDDTLFKGTKTLGNIPEKTTAKKN